MIRYIATLVLGLIVLAGVYALLVNVLFLLGGSIGLLIVLIVAGFPGILDLIWFAAIAAIVIIGLHRKLPGLTIAPLVFFASWCCVSIWNRYEVATTLDPSLSSRPVPLELRNVRTLILVGQGDQCCGHIRLLVDHVIDRYVYVQTNAGGDVVAIRSTQVAAAENCDAKELIQSGELQRSGRTDQCLKTTTLDAIPDGLVVRMQSMKPSYASYGCCNVGTISIRQNNEERVAATWRYGQQTILSYLPLFKTNFPPTPLWQYASVGPRQLVEIGGPPFLNQDLAAAVYGIDWTAPLKFAQVSNAELSRRAKQLAHTKNDLAALEIALQVQRNGYIDDILIGAVSQLIDSPYDQQLLTFWQHLDGGNKHKFVEGILARISDPTTATGDYSQARLQIQMQREQLTAYMPQAEAIFVNRRDLKTWQYEMALRLAMNNTFAFTTDEYRDEQRRRFQSLQNDTTDAFARRAVAFKRVYFPPNEEERAFFAQHLDRVPDALLEQFIRQVGLGRASDFSQRIRERLNAVRDEKLKRDLQQQFNVRGL